MTEYQPERSLPITFLLQNKIEETNNSVLVEMCELNEYFFTLEAKLSVTNQVNTLLSSRLISVEQCWHTLFQTGMSRHNRHSQEVPQSLSSFRERRTSSRFGVLRETCKK